MIAAIGFQLLLCSVASAAGACTDTLDRSARRLPAQMAQVLREIVERHAAARVERIASRRGFTLADCARLRPAGAPRAGVFTAEHMLPASLLNLPPPAMG